MSVLPQAPEAAGVAEYIVLAETVTQIGIDPTGPADSSISNGGTSTIGRDKSPSDCYGGSRDQFRLYPSTDSVGSGNTIAFLNESQIIVSATSPGSSSSGWRPSQLR